MLNIEKQQLINQWAKISTLVCADDSLDYSYWNTKQIYSVLNDDVIDIKTKKKKINSHIRKFTDKLGLQAWGAVENGGKCCGAFYRTKGFVDLPEHERIGSKQNKSIHIEHTVPVVELASQILTDFENFKTKESIFSYLLINSICTAVLESQKKMLEKKGFSKSSNVFVKSSDSYKKPFHRYNSNSCAFPDNTIFDVWRQREVDLDCFTLEDHFQNIYEVAQFTKNFAILSFIKKSETYWL
jgi:hypothetical protein